MQAVDKVLQGTKILYKSQKYQLLLISDTSTNTCGCTWSNIRPVCQMQVPYLDKKAQVNILRFRLSSPNFAIVFMANINTLKSCRKRYLLQFVHYCVSQHLSTAIINDNLNKHWCFKINSYWKIFLEILPFWWPEKKETCNWYYCLTSDSCQIDIWKDLFSEY